MNQSIAVANKPNSIQKLTGPPNRLLSTWQLMRTPYSTYSRWCKRYGKTFLVKALNGNVVVTSNTENIRRILSAKHDEITQFAIGTITPLIGDKSVLIVNGEDHKRARNLLTPPFRGENLRKCQQTMAEIAARTASNWKSGERIKMMDVSLDYSLDVIIQVVFGVQNLELVSEFKRQIKTYVKSFWPIFAFTKFFQRRWFPPWSRFLKQKELFNAMLDTQIDLGRANLAEAKDCGEDILTMLLAARDEDGNPLGDDELKDHLITLLFAGHETTQIALSWAMSWLHREPAILARLRSELEDADELEQCLESELLHGVCMESLRLNPIVADFLRVFHNPIELEEITLPPNSSVAVLSSEVHQNPEVYPEPQRFNPERWNDASVKPHEFLAFGGGVRRCIGATMALVEMKIALATWLRAFSFELPDDAPEVEPVHRRNLTLAPKSGIELVVK